MAAPASNHVRPAGTARSRRERLRPALGLFGLLVLTALAGGCRSDAEPVVLEPGATSVPTVETAVADPTVTEPTAAAADDAAPTPPPSSTATPAATPTTTPAPTPAPASIGDLLALSALEAVACPSNVAAQQVSCSVATLPQDVVEPLPGEVIEVLIAFVDNGDPNGIGPVVFLQGGPGVASTDLASRFVGSAHDLYFIDHRGTGYSTPKLDCPEVDALWEAQYSDDPAVRLPDDDGETLEAAYEVCADRLAAGGIEFDDFNTRSAAVDIELIRQLFGHDEWSLWGISYGTRLGLTVMRDHPQGVRAAVLDSIVPYEVDFFATIPENAVRSLRALDAACDRARCAADHGDFFDNLSRLVLELDEQPVVVTATRPGSGATFPFRVDGETLVNMVFTQMYSTRSLRALPRQIARAEFGGLDEIVNTYVNRRDPTELDLSIGLYYTTWCREEFPFYDASIDDQLLIELAPLFGDAADGALSSDGIDTFCGFFGVAPAAPSENEPFASDIPSLVFAGAFDPITPPQWSQQVAAELSNTTYVELPDHGHGMSTTCPALIRIDFLTDPGEPPDTTCAAQTGGPEFE